MEARDTCSTKSQPQSRQFTLRQNDWLFNSLLVLFKDWILRSLLVLFKDWILVVYLSQNILGVINIFCCLSHNKKETGIIAEDHVLFGGVIKELTYSIACRAQVSHLENNFIIY